MGAVLAVALALRLGFVLETQVPNPIRADAAHYVQYARNLHEHGVFSLEQGAAPRPDSFRSPGYPCFLALHAMLFGDANLYTSARLSQTVVDTGSVGLAYLLARQFMPFASALAVAALTALSPHLVASTGYLLTETLTTFALMLALVGLQAVLRGRGRGVLAGVGFALASLSSEAFTPLPYLLALLAWRQPLTGGDSGVRRGLAVMLAICVAAQGAWTVRNAVAVAADAPRGSSRALQTISHGTYPGLVFHDPRLRYMPYREDPEQPRFGEDLDHFTRVLAVRVKERPLRYASWYLLEKPFYLWGFDGLQAAREIYTYEPVQSLYDRHAVAEATLTLMRWLHWPAVACAVVGLLVLRRRRHAGGVETLPQTLPLRLLGACLLYGTLVGVVFAPWPRYVIPLRPVLFAVAVFGAAAAWRAAAKAAPASAPASIG